MRIDFNLASQAVQESDRIPQLNSQSLTASSASRTPAQAAAVRASEDQAQLSNSYGQARALAVQASQLPEIRQARVESLRSAVLDGQYHPEPEQVARALVDHMIVAKPHRE